MAATRTKVPAIGSAQWVLDERKQADDLVAQELEDFGFSVRNELEWLNEHMADIFAQNGQYVTPVIYASIISHKLVGTSWTFLRRQESCGERHHAQRGSRLPSLVRCVSSVIWTMTEC